MKLRVNPLTININQDVVDKVNSGDYKVVDIETDGLMYDYTKVWVLSVYDPLTKQVVSYTGDDIIKGLQTLQGQILVGHNILKFDLPILLTLYPTCGLTPKQALDTLVMSKLGNPARPGGHALANWATRYGMQKQEHEDWGALSAEMVQRCETDVRITAQVFLTLKGELEVMPLAVEIEHSVAYQTGVVERQGFMFDVPFAQSLLEKYTVEYTDTLAALQKLWPTRVVSSLNGASKTLKVVSSRSPYYGLLDPNVEFSPVKIEEFSGSRQQAADRLQKTRGWKPKKFTEGGEPVLNEETLLELDYPEVKLLLKFYDLEKKIAFLKSRPDRKVKNGWLDVVHKDSRIHCSLDYNKAYTHRMACSSPNLQQVSTEGDMRACFIPTPGWELVGVDAKGLELRVLAHYVAKYDEGVWGKEVVEGDPHTANQKQLGCWARNTAKRIIYAYPYGAGESKLGAIWLEDQVEYAKACEKTGEDPAQWRPRYEVLGLKKGATKTDIGKAIKKLPLFGAIEKVKMAGKRSIETKGWVPSFDGRKVRSSKEHIYSVIATLAQSGGAVIMKAAIYLCPEVFASYGLEYGKDYRFVMYIHDEFQIEARPEKVETVKQAGIKTIQLAGVLLNLRVPMDGDAKSGISWKETH